jgi:HlyD family secretion protein
LRQDMTVSVNIETGRRERALVVPNDALSIVDGSHAMVLSVRNGKVKRVPVTLGLRGLSMTEIVSGLNAGDWVLADANSKLVDGERVRAAGQVATSAAFDLATKKELPINLN